MTKLNRIKIALNLVGEKMPRKEYVNYKNALKTLEKNVNKASCSRFYFVPTANRIMGNYGGTKGELLTTLQSQDFINEIYILLKGKGYKLPKSNVFMESYVPSWSGIGAVNVGDQIVYNPRSINRITPRAVFHEIGHLMHEKKQKMNPIVFKFFSVKDKHIPFLTKKEKEIFLADIERATKEGHFRGIPFECWTKDPLLAFGEVSNKLVKGYKKNAAKRNAMYPLTNRFEFIADVFSLRLQGFKFSPEIVAKYEKFGGPKITEVISDKELSDLLKLQKKIRKKSLADYERFFL